MDDHDERDRRELREDFRRLTEQVNVLREANAAQDVVNTTIQEDVQKLTDSVTALTSAIDKSRGALWVISGVSGAAGAFVSWLAGAFIHRGN